MNKPLQPEQATEKPETLPPAEGDISMQDFKRVPFGSPQQQLATSQIPGYHLHWINDWHPQMANRLQQAEAAGYRYVKPEEVDYATPLGNPTTDLGGHRVSRTVGTRPDGSPITAYLMKIPQEWWIEHQKPVWERANQVDAAIKRGPKGATPIEEGYVPKGDRISISSKIE